MKFRDKLNAVRMPGLPRGIAVRDDAVADLADPVAVADNANVEDEVQARSRVDVDLEGDGDASPSLSHSRLSTIRNLRSRLASMHAKPAPAPVAAALGPVRAQLARVAAPKSVVPGERSETALGPLYRVVVKHDEDHRHGSALVSLAARVCPQEVALLALDPALADIDYSRALYIDTETTGLAGGTGTLPFLIGMAWFEGECLVVEQLVLPRPGLEGPMLARLAERLAQASAIVSYNGKSFDWPLLRTRFILNRIAAPRLPPHLDLLHAARRVYKSRLGSVRLIFLEQALMGFERIDDIPGELIPETYLSFLRGATPGETLLPILDHNRSDLIALPALLGEIVRRFAGDQRQDPRDQLSFARVLSRGDASLGSRPQSSAPTERAIAFAHAAVESDLRGELAATALYLVGELKLRQGDLEGAIGAFEGSLAASVGAFDNARAHLALAKLHEHKTKQCARALAHAAETAACEGEDATARRVARLGLRLAKLAQGRHPGARPEAPNPAGRREKGPRNSANT
ncbi:MAG: Glutamate synthase large chain [Myxococcaceae bacterium]|nr:Glutamate synthase large chain [Myxococcaceae bacterium]